jgi:hypothetical protein
VLPSYAWFVKALQVAKLDPRDPQLLQKAQLVGRLGGGGGRLHPRVLSWVPRCWPGLGTTGSRSGGGDTVLVWGLTSPSTHGRHRSPSLSSLT